MAEKLLIIRAAQTNTTCVKFLAISQDANTIGAHRKDSDSPYHTSAELISIAVKMDARKGNL